jgi:hypothetical protein
MTNGSALPISRNPFHAGDAFRGFTGSLPLRPARLLAPLHGSDWDAPALGDFYNQAFDGSVSLPVAGYNYNSGWISFCWRDLHPLEWQLASLHGQLRRRARLIGQPKSESGLRRLRRFGSVSENLLSIGEGRTAPGVPGQGTACR